MLTRTQKCHPNKLALRQKNMLFETNSENIKYNTHINIKSQYIHISQQSAKMTRKPQHKSYPKKYKSSVINFHMININNCSNNNIYIYINMLNPKNEHVLSFSKHFHPMISHAINIIFPKNEPNKTWRTNDKHQHLVSN